MIEICPAEQCTGCSACYAACNNHAITIQKDEYGFEYPKIDPQNCKECGLCSSICPNNANLRKTQCSVCYVSHAKDSKEQLTSTSGGLASVISRYIIRKGGVVYGCSAQIDLKIGHIRIENENEIELLKGSKYVQSHIGYIYKNVKNDLLANRLVLFIGTPCQVAGLKSFLRKGFENLVTVDFVCHGVPSVQFLKDSIGRVDVSKLRPAFRYKLLNADKISYKSEYGVYLLSENNNIVYKQVYPHGLFILGFINALFYRRSCYQCHYTTPARISDFTLGDYNDAEAQYRSLSGHDRILSMVMINTSRAEKMWEGLSLYVDSSLCSLETMIKKHDQLHKPMAKHGNYDLFNDLYLRKGFNYAVKKSLSKEILGYKIKAIKKIVTSVPGISLFFKSK